MADRTIVLMRMLAAGGEEWSTPRLAQKTGIAEGDIEYLFKHHMDMGRVMRNRPRGNRGETVVSYWKLLSDGRAYLKKQIGKREGEK